MQKQRFLPNEPPLTTLGIFTPPTRHTQSWLQSMTPKNLPLLQQVKSPVPQISLQQILPLSESKLQLVPVQGQSSSSSNGHLLRSSYKSPLPEKLLPNSLDRLQKPNQVLQVSELFPIVPVRSAPKTSQFFLPEPCLEEYFSKHDTKFLQSLFLSIQQITYNSIAPSTQNSYASIYDSIIIKKTLPVLKYDPFPFDNEVTVKIIFTLLLSCSQINNTYINKEDGKLRWSNVLMLKAAIMATVALNNAISVFTSPTPAFSKFWTGLKNSCSHATKEKIVVSFHLVISACIAAHNASKSHPLSQEDYSTIRRAAMMAIGFFGIRRNAEVINLTKGCIRTTANFTIIHVPSSKNDKLSLGHNAIIPKLQRFQSGCPVTAINRWADEAELFLEDALIPYSDASPFFFNLSGKNIGKQISVDTHRKDVSKAYKLVYASNPGKVLSLRRGGAHLFASHNHRNVSKQQGAWRSQSVLDGTYAKISDAEFSNIMRTILNTVYEKWMVENGLQRVERFYNTKIDFGKLAPGVFANIHAYRHTVDFHKFMEFAPNFISSMKKIRFSNQHFEAFRKWYGDSNA